MSDVLMTREPQALAVADETVSLFERLARDPSVDVEKLERLIGMQERIMRHQAEAAFNAAFSEMQAQIPTIAERGRTDKTTYALLEDIIEQCKPVLQAHGFSLSHRTEWPSQKTVKVIGILTHRAGHSRQSEFLSDADASGSKNAIQGLGSAIAYGRRYTTADLLNIVSRKDDDDGYKAAAPRKVETPPKFDEWQDSMIAVADEGLDALQAAWKASSRAFREHTDKHEKVWWANLKAKASKVAA